MSRPTFSKQVATIPNGQAVSNSMRLGGESIVAISSIGAGWTAAVLAFEVSFDDGTTWLPVFDDTATEVAIASASIAAVGRAIVPNATGAIRSLGGLNHVRLASGPAGARVNQGANQTFTIWTRSP